MKKEAVLILASLFLLIGAGCENSDYFAAGNCNEISDANKRIECLDNSYKMQAAKVGDKSLCSRIINPGIKENCMSQSFVPANCDKFTVVDGEVVCDLSEICGNIIIVDGKEVCGDEN